MRMPTRIDECWTIEGANWVQKTQTGQPVDFSEEKILELEEAARYDFLALGETRQERRAAAAKIVYGHLASLGVSGKPRQERKRIIKNSEKRK